MRTRDGDTPAYEIVAIAICTRCRRRCIYLEAAEEYYCATCDTLPE